MNRDNNSSDQESNYQSKKERNFTRDKKSKANETLFNQEMNPQSHVTIEKISNNYIGGCIILDKKNNVSIDNTIRTDISQRMKEINI